MVSQRHRRALALLLVAGLAGCHDAARDTAPAAAPIARPEPTPPPPPPPKVDPKDDVSPEREVARLRAEVQALDAGMKKLVHRLAVERVEVRHLGDAVDDLATKQSADKERLAALKAAVASATDPVAVGGRKTSAADAKAELDAGLKQFDVAQKALDARQAALASRMQTRDNLEKQAAAMKDQKAELQTAVDKLESELGALKLQPAAGKPQTDDARLAKIKDDLEKLKKKLDVDREKLKLSPLAPEPITPGGKSVDDIVRPLKKP